MPAATAPAPDPPHETLEGTLERVVYRSDDDRFLVALVQIDGHPTPLRVVGELAGLGEGERVRLIGAHRVDPRHGPQFKVVAGYPVLPHTRQAVEAWLAAGHVKSIGKTLAARLVAWFGDKTLHVILDAPERLEEVEGIGPKRRREIAAQVAERAHQRDALIFLQSLGVQAGTARRIFRRYDANTIPLVRDNPYRLAEEVSGIGFATADRIAHALGFGPDHPARAAAALVHLLARAAEEGHVYLPRDVLLDRAAALLGDAPIAAVLDATLAEGRLIAEADAIYLLAAHRTELEITHRLCALLAAPVEALPLDVDHFQATTGLTLAPAQRAALDLAATAPVMVLTGGPGTGKTTIVRALLHQLRARGPVALAAPTGRAARRMAEATGAEAHTLHRLLGYHPGEGFRRDEEDPLDCHALVVDEASMVDQQLMCALLRAIRPGTRLILVGDADQLPSVGAGDVLADLLESGAIPHVRLTEIFRQAEQSRIVVEAHRVLRGETPTRSRDEDSDFFLVPAKDPARAAELIRTLVTERIPRRFGLDPIDDIQVLAPMHRGVCGAQQLNALLQDAQNPHGEPFERGNRRYRVGDKVMQIRNDYDKDVFNGDLGRVVARTDKGLAVRFEDRLVEIDGEALDNLVLAYACSVHKSQGSEYPAVVVPVLTEHWVMLQRNLLYTAITRGKRLVVLVAEPRALHRAARNVDGLARYTGLARRLAERAA
ncbi:MAG: ATP-dependent RecD-like DNA helicase [Myxococcales bacterium]|nr:ATP-dependent RecD-like DNA helicase [Myxococcales bacterium]